MILNFNSLSVAMLRFTILDATSIGLYDSMTMWNAASIELWLKSGSSQAMSQAIDLWPKSGSSQAVSQL